MKILQLQHIGPVQATAYRTGRRILTILPDTSRRPTRRRAGRRPGRVRLAVRTVPEEWSGFEPVIRVLPERIKPRTAKDL